MNRSLLGYYALFLYNTNEDLSPEVMILIEKFQEWEMGKKNRDHSNWMGSIEIINQEEKI